MTTIRLLLLSFSTVFAVVLYAQAPVDFVEQVRVQGPRCYEVSSTLTTNPIQSMTVKVSNEDLSGEAVPSMAFLNVSLRLRGAAQTHQAFMLCESDGHCAVECDGGSVRVMNMTDGDLQVHNNEFYADASCSPDGKDSKEETRPTSDLISSQVFSDVTLQRVDKSRCE